MVMPATDSELASMEEPHTVEDEKGSMTNVSSSSSSTTTPVSLPSFPTTVTNFSEETVIENRAVSMASDDCSAALSSPAEASPAKSAVTSPNTFEGTVETSPATSLIASASDSLKCTGTSHVNIEQSLPTLPSSTFGRMKNNFSAALNFKGVTVTLENNNVWTQFYSCGTEMILAKQGRRMFPYCRYRLAGLDPERQYSLVLSIVPSDKYKYRWTRSGWEITGQAEHQAQGLTRAFSHHYSPCKGSEWMGGLVSFYRLKLTNNTNEQDDHIMLHSMHRYVPRLHVIPVPDGVVSTADQPVVMGLESMTFTFPQTEFMSVTTYQNFRITQLKINYNPFAKGFRHEGHNPRLTRVTTEIEPVMKTDTQSTVSEPSESKEVVVDLSPKTPIIPTPVSKVKGTRLVLKPIMSTPSSKDELYVPCLRGKHALGELVLVEKPSAMDEKHNVSGTPKVQQAIKVMPPFRATPTPRTSTPRSAPGVRGRRKTVNRGWANSRIGELKAAAVSPVSPSVIHSPLLTVAFQPELDDVEGLLFVSFTSKEALDVHISNKPPNHTAPALPASASPQTQLKPTVELIQGTNEEKIGCMEAILLLDLRALKRRQVIHPVLQAVGLKLSSLNPTKSIDLQYLGVDLPLPPVIFLKEVSYPALSLGDKGFPFISRTGKTSDMTKIKGWKNKFIKSKEKSPNSDGLQKNLSAFCSDMLDEYLESEAQQISERAAAFSANPEGSVAYQLPAKGSSYVKTLDSVLKHRSTASTRPCPLSYKPLLDSAAVTSKAPPLPSPATPAQAESRSIHRTTSSRTQPGPSPRVGAKGVSGSDHAGGVSQRSSPHQPCVSQKSTMSSGQNHGMRTKPLGLTKFQLKLSQMEIGALNHGLSRKQLTPDRLTLALSVILTKQMQHIPSLKVPRYQENTGGGPECGQEFCRLGCVCSSLQHLIRQPFHCRRLECMFDCACFKRKLTKQIATGESPQTIQPVYSLTNVKHVVQPAKGSHSNKLWNRNIHDVDAEPLFIPKSPPCFAPGKIPKPGSVKPIREEDKDPVYKYLESMMTCARVREFNSLPPPVLTLEPKVPDSSPAHTTMEQQKASTNDPPGHYDKTIQTRNTGEKTWSETSASEMVARKQIQIQSACHWNKDCKLVLETLYQRLNQRMLCQPFRIGPYQISPVSKIFMRKPSGSIVTYRVRISKPLEASDDEEDKFEDSDDENLSKSFDGDSQTQESGMKVGVIPFLSGVLPAGILRARTKPVGLQEPGLIQVNSKSYNQARVLLGSMGSLHPANRLAAHLTGRLRALADIHPKDSHKPGSTPKNDPAGTLYVEAADTAVTQIITPSETTDAKMHNKTQPLAQLQPDSSMKGPVTVPQHSQNSSDANPIQSFISNLQSSVSTICGSSVSSPVFLTVSPSLKAPSFLGQSGTYSFRICPPAHQSATGQDRPGVTLPGGFTLIELPKPETNDASLGSETANTTNMAGVDKSMPQPESLYNSSQFEANLDANWLCPEILHAGQDLSSSSSSLAPGSSPKLMPDQMSSDLNGQANGRLVGSVMDFSSDDLSSDDSDYCGEGDEDDEPVDVETVEEEIQGMAITKMKEYALKALQKSRNYRDHVGSAKGLTVQDDMDEVQARDRRRRNTHTVLERQRRFEQRNLFDKLQTLLKSDPRAPRLHLLSLALKEIQNLVQASKFLEEKKRGLTELHSTYVKKLSLLSGKSEVLIKLKLSDICKKQKMRDKKMKLEPFFSRLLQSRAALLQSASPVAKQTPLLVPDFSTPPSLTSTNATHSNVQQVMGLLQPRPRPAQSNALIPQHVPNQAAVVAAPSGLEAVQASLRKSNVENHQAATGLPAWGSMPDSLSLVPSGAATLQVVAAQHGPSPISLTPIPQASSTQPPPSAPIPLMRSKTGRIILPSSMKPIGNGFYTLMLMEGKQDKKDGEPSSAANTQPHVDSDRILEEDKTTSSNSHPKPPPVQSPLAKPACLNESIYLLSATMLDQGTAPDPNCAVVRRGRGRPRKNTPFPPDSKKKSTRLTKKRAADTKVANNPVPEKRGRGRPPNKRPAKPGRPVGQNRQSKSNEDSPFRLSSPATKPKAGPAASTSHGGGNALRPLTRGSLGKDFPSAKKRSWIDLEKELDPELEIE